MLVNLWSILRLSLFAFQVEKATVVSKCFSSFFCNARVWTERNAYVWCPQKKHLFTESSSPLLFWFLHLSLRWKQRDHSYIRWAHWGTTSLPLACVAARPCTHLYTEGLERLRGRQPPTEIQNKNLFSVLFDSMSCVGVQGFCWLCWFLHSLPC